MRAISTIALLGHRDIHRRNVGVQYPRKDAPYVASLAPLYDVASMDGQQDERWQSLGITIGGEEEIEKVDENAWVRLAHECHTDPGEVLGIVAQTASRLPGALEEAITQARNEDEWRNAKEAENRIEALRRGVGQRAGRARRPTRHPRRRPAPPDWVDIVINAMNHSAPSIELKANEQNRNIEIIAHDANTGSRTIGVVRSPRAQEPKSPRAFYEALADANAVKPAEVPELERTLERDRQRQIELAHIKDR